MAFADVMNLQMEGYSGSAEALLGLRKWHAARSGLWFRNGRPIKGVGGRYFRSISLLHLEVPVVTGVAGDRPSLIAVNERVVSRGGSACVQDEETVRRKNRQCRIGRFCMRLTTYTPYCAGFVSADAQFDVQVPELSLATCPPLFELGAALRPFLDVIQHFLSAAPSPTIVLLQRTATSCLWTRDTAHDTLRPT
jgi:hypothetical protein